MRAQALTPRWRPLSYHPAQYALYWASRSRFRIVPAGRRSGKTEIAKRWVVARACRTSCVGRKYAFAAPTRDQAKRIYWIDLKALVPAAWVSQVSETELTIVLRNGTRLCVVGMDRPERIEGEPLDGIVLDEYANMKQETWMAHVFPALNTPGRPPGWAWFIGVPEGRNHYWELWQDVPRLQALGESWDRFTWKSADIMSPEQLETLRRSMDERTFRQELEGSFESFAGLAYYNWSDANVAPVAQLYDASRPLIFCFDFNTSPGVCIVAQHWQGQKITPEQADDGCTIVIAETWIEKHSNTPMVCRAVLNEWGMHPGEVHVYGDATGGAKGTTAVLGSDWDIIEREFARAFGQRLSMRNRTQNSDERARVNAVNSRVQSTDGKIRLYVDPKYSAKTIRDFEQVETVEGSGELLKVQGGPLTHATDALGYYIADKFPVSGTELWSADVA